MQRRKFLGSVFALGTAATVAPSFAWSVATPKKSDITAAFLTDVHVFPDPAAEEGMAKAFRHVNQLKTKPDLLFNGGDAIMDALKATKADVEKQWAVWNKILARENKLPIHHIIGNHDVWGWQMKDEAVKKDPLYDKAWALAQHKLQSRYYSFTKGNWKFIVLDSAQDNNGSYIARIDEEQFQWLEKELAASKAYHICIASHIPIVSFCAGMFFDKNEPNGDLKILRVLLHTDTRRLVNLFRQFPNVKCCLSGHIHMQDVVEYFGVRYFCNGAISGNWWKGAFNGFDPAYAMFRFTKDGKVERNMINYNSQN